MQRIFTIIFLCPIILYGQNLDSLLNQGQRLLQLGRNDLALEKLMLAEDQLEDTDGLEAAQCYNDLGVVYYNNGNRSIALEYLNKGLIIRQKELSNDDILLGDSYLNLGLIYLGEDYLQSIIYFNKALDSYQKSLPSTDPKIALCFSNIAYAHRDAKNYNDAMTYLQLTMEIWDKTYTGMHPNKAYTMSNQGLVLELMGDLDDALDLQKQSLAQYKELYGEKHPEVAVTYSAIASIQLKQKKYTEALLSYQKSIYANLDTQEFESPYDLPKISGYYNAQYLLRSLQAKAQTLEARHFEKSLSPKDVKSSLDTYKKCNELISVIRQRRLNEDDKIRIGAIANSIYDNAIRISLYLSDKTLRPNYYQEMAFSFCESSKSATLLEAINETKAKSFAGIPDNLIRLEDSIKDQISFLEKEVAQASDDNEALKLRLFDFQKSYREFISRLETDYPEYYNLKYQTSEVSTSEIQRMLKPGTVLLSYFIGASTIYIFELSAKDFIVHEKDRDPMLIKKIAGLRNSIKYNVKQGFDLLSKELKDQLIPEIQESGTLIIIPDGILGTIPFESLLTNKQGTPRRYLIEDYAISYDYAASLFLEKSKSSTNPDLKTIYLSAPISFNENEVYMSPLPGTKDEVEQIKYLFEGQSLLPKVCLDNQATETSIKSAQLNEYKYLHFATHGIVNESHPELSRIFLKPDNTEDGSLYSGEIYNLNLSADLVTLSACETGLGKIEKGEGIIGLSRSLTYAGAKNLIVSLWQVSDASTAELMIEFYRQHLTNGDNTTYSGDLRKAKLAAIKTDNYTNPYYWAPFILIGQ